MEEDGKTSCGADDLERIGSPPLFYRDALCLEESPKTKPSVGSAVSGKSQGSSHGAPCPDCGCPPPSIYSPMLSVAPTKSFPAGTPLADGEPISLESSPFTDTVRCMRYKAFLRWYYGAHERGWSGAATGVFCLLAGALIIFSFYSVCSLHVLNPATVIIFISIVIVLSIALLIMSGVRFVPHLSVRISTLFILTAIIVVVVVNSRQEWDWTAAFGVLTGSSKGIQSVYDTPLAQASPAFQSLLSRAAEEAGCHLNTTTSSSSQRGFTPRALQGVPQAQASEEKCQTYKWFPVSFFIIQGGLFVAAVFYSFILNRMAKWYYLKSRWFISGWTVCSCTQVELLVPALGQSDRKRTTDFVTSAASEALRGKSKAAGKAGSKNLQTAAMTPHPQSDEKPSSGDQAQGGPSLKSATESDEAEEAVDRLRLARGLKVDLSVYSPMSATFESIFCWCCRRKAKSSEASLMVPEKVGCWKRKHEGKPGDPDAKVPKSKGRRSSRSRKTITSTFIGEVDSEGRPEGFGFWRDESYDFGQRLVGYWRNGIPDGPHKSRELGTGSGFMCIRIGWAAFTLSDNTLRFGVANVECSVSGKFYKGYPSVELLLPPGRKEPRKSAFGLLTARDNTEANESAKQAAGGENRKKSVVRFSAEPQPLEYLPREEKSSSTLGAGKSFLSGTESEFSNSSWKNNWGGDNQSDVEAGVTQYVRFSAVCQHASDTPESPNKGVPDSSQNAKAQLPVPNAQQQPESPPEGEGVPRSPARKIGDFFTKTAPQQIRKSAFGARDVIQKALRKGFLDKLRNLKRSQREIGWCLAELSPHTPNFGVQPRSEMMISFDPSRGLCVSGYVPADSIEHDKSALKWPNLAALATMEKMPALFVEALADSVSRKRKSGEGAKTDERKSPVLRGSVADKMKRIARGAAASTDEDGTSTPTRGPSVPSDTLSETKGSPPSEIAGGGAARSAEKDTESKGNPDTGKNLVVSTGVHGVAFDAEDDLQSEVPQMAQYDSGCGSSDCTIEMSPCQNEQFDTIEGPRRRWTVTAQRHGAESPAVSEGEKSKPATPPVEDEVKEKPTIVLPTLEESYTRMASAGLTPFYQRPTLDKLASAKPIREVLVRVVKRRLIVSTEGTQKRPSAALKSTAEPATQTCSCECHRDENPTAFHQEKTLASKDNPDGMDKYLSAPAPYEPDYLDEKAYGEPSKQFGDKMETEELDVAGWVSADAVGSPEVLLYIHGYNNSQTETLQILGQMAGFGNYPNYIRLFVFSWPAGSGFWEFFKARQAAEDPATHQALADFLTALRDNGIRDIHIMCHSMGARLFLKSFREISEGLFQKYELGEEKNQGSMEFTGGILDTPEGGKLRLVSVTFLNPEYFLDEFVSIDYPSLRSYTSHISVFADAKDQALWWSETLSGRPALGKTVFGLWRTTGPKDEGDSDVILKAPPRVMNTVSFFQFGSQPAKQGQPEGEVSAMWGSLPDMDGRKVGDPSFEWLDVDVIDTTWMDQNIHGMRHSFWNLNREIIEDIRELMVTRKRAQQRMGRLDRSALYCEYEWIH